MSDKFHMDVTGIALGGMQTAQGMLEKTADRLANVGAITAEGTGDTVDLSAEMVSLMTARQQFEANAAAFRTADEMQKNLVNMLL